MTHIDAITVFTGINDSKEFTTRIYIDFSLVGESGEDTIIALQNGRITPAELAQETISHLTSMGYDRAYAERGLRTRVGRLMTLTLDDFRAEFERYTK